MTRYEDRLGRVTETEYDSNGNRTFRRVGIVNTAVYNQASPNTSDNAINDDRLLGDDEEPGEFATYRWEYHDSGPNANLLEKSFDANNNETQYFYTPVNADGTSDHLIARIDEADDDGTGFHTKMSYVYEDARAQPSVWHQVPMRWGVRQGISMMNVIVRS